MTKTNTAASTIDRYLHARWPVRAARVPETETETVPARVPETVNEILDRRIARAGGGTRAELLEDLGLPRRRGAATGLPLHVVLEELGIIR